MIELSRQQVKFGKWHLKKEKLMNDNLVKD